MKRRILLVDDDVTVLLTLKAVLELHGFDVETATTAGEALHKLQSSVYHMVITDVRMETEQAGLEVIHAARAQKYDPATALLTAYPPEDGDWGEQGAQSVLVKPVGTETLVRQLESLLVQHEDAKQRRRDQAALVGQRSLRRPSGEPRRKVS